MNWNQHLKEFPLEVGEPLQTNLVTLHLIVKIKETQLGVVIDIVSIVEIVQCQIKEKDHLDPDMVIRIEEIQKIENTIIMEMIVIKMEKIIQIPVVVKNIKENLYMKEIKNHLRVDCIILQKLSNKEGKKR